MISQFTPIILTNALAVSTILASCLPLSRLGLASRSALLVSFFLILLIPINQLMLIGYIRGFIGDLSITSYTLILARLFSIVNLRRPTPNNDKYRFSLIMTIVALCFYPTSLGLTHFSPYDAAYFSHLIIGCVVILGCYFWFTGFYLVTICFSLAIVSHHYHLLESTNIWDYLIDPILFSYCLFYLILYQWRHLKSDKAVELSRD